VSKEITINVGYVKAHIKMNKEFIIHIVPNRFTVDYPAYYKDLVSIIGLTDKYKLAGDNEEKLKEIEKELEGLGLEHILESKYNLIKSVLIANEYEFDREWWDSRVDPKETDNFINECVKKDQSPEAKKKVLELMGKKPDWITEGLLGR
jgi:hypothetical protein